MPLPTQDLKQLLSANFLLHLIIANEVKLTPYGTITVNIEIKDGIADIKTINIVKNRRKKYNP